MYEYLKVNKKVSAHQFFFVETYFTATLYRKIAKPIRLDLMKLKSKISKFKDSQKTATGLSFPDIR